MPAPVPPAKPRRARPAAAARLRAFGRSLGDFGALSPAETTLLDCCRQGVTAIVDAARPSQETPQNAVRAAFVRFLALGGDESAPVHEKGVELNGAWITGALDLCGATVAHPILLAQCALEEADLRQSHLKALMLSGSRMSGILSGDGLHCGDLFLRDGFEATKDVLLRGIHIDGDLDCSGGHFLAGTAHALDCDSATISKYLFLRDGFRSVGKVNLLGITVGRNIECAKAVFEGGDDVALNCSSATVAGGVYIRHGFRATGAVLLVRSTIAGDLDCIGGSFVNPQGMALSCSRAEIEGGFFFYDLAKVSGRVSLSAMTAGQMCDDLKSWPGPGSLHLDGFSYGRLVGPAPTLAADRIAWLNQQIPEHLGAEFRPQPWEQLSGVLRAMGHPEEARSIAVAKQDQRRRAGKILRGARSLHWLYGVLVGYGYRPMRLLAATAAVWLLCFLVYWAATNPAWFGAETYLLAPPPAEAGEAGEAAPAVDHRNFVPLIYSADVLLPVVDLGYKDEWQPVVADAHGDPLIAGQLLRFLYWFEIAFGWIAGLLLVGVLGNLIKKD